MSLALTYTSAMLRRSATLVVVFAVSSCSGSRIPEPTIDLQVNGTLEYSGTKTDFTATNQWVAEGTGSFGLRGAGPFLSKTVTGATKASFLVTAPETGLSVGPNAFSPSTTVSFPDGQLRDFDFAGSFVVERMRFTGERYSPVELTGTLSGKTSGNDLNATWSAEVTGRFVLHADCSGDVGGVALSSGVCGDSLLAKTIQTGDKADKPESGQYGGASGDCPAEVLAVFVDGSAYDYTVSAQRVGQAKALRCLETFDVSYTKEPYRFCGEAATGVQADGCTWTVDAFSTPVKTMTVLGVANEGCARPQGRFCASTLTAVIP